MESWVGLGGKEGRTNIQISAEPVLNWEPCGILQLRQPRPPRILTLSVPVVFLNSPNLSPYFSLNKFERIWLLIFSNWLCLINSHFLITKCHILYVLYKEKLVVDNWLALKGLIVMLIILFIWFNVIAVIYSILEKLNAPSKTNLMSIARRTVDNPNNKSSQTTAAKLVLLTLIILLKIFN